MTRAALPVRDAQPDDIVAIMHLTATVLDESEGHSHAGVRRLLEGPDMRNRQTQFEKLLTDADVRTIVATDPLDDTVVTGVAVLSRDTISAVFESPAIFVNYLLVPDNFRNRGIGKALLCEATRYADRCGAKHLIVGVSSTARETNRYYARLGFAPLVVRRIASVAHLRKSLGMASTYAERLRIPLNFGRRAQRAQRAQRT
ncbi:L-amino acid N-acyltransferase YncA [Antricoccus suffuscus]|uniref:L-amino acid N-acyltransferase YncA n=1 Tax=Antricoccus suffuscus TaxID=1629062 RepID=A0A2T0ZW44_9ACTN|nr:GNAT family N-acetyltransferase [Antricoccus suffuscus]PRZ40586.1 L-amino acid N-acyltransferase YncA [Antricoccus suffuscus]